MKRIIAVMVLSLSIFIGFADPALAGTIDGARDEICAGVSATGGGCDSGAGGELSTIIAAVLNILSWIAGIAAVIMIIVSGLKYITSGGDSGGVSSAKQSLIFALVGLVIVALAQFIVQFVLDAVI